MFVFVSKLCNSLARQPAIKNATSNCTRRSRHPIRIRVEILYAHCAEEAPAHMIYIDDTIAIGVLPLHCRDIRDDVSCAKDLLVLNTLPSENLHAHGKPNTKVRFFSLYFQQSPPELISYIMQTIEGKTYGGIVVSISGSQIDDAAHVGHPFHQDVGSKPGQIIR